MLRGPRAVTTAAGGKLLFSNLVKERQRVFMIAQVQLHQSIGKLTKQLERRIHQREQKVEKENHGKWLLSHFLQSVAG